MLPNPDDQVEITQLLARYCVTLDVGDLEAWVDLFLPDARYEVFEGHEGLRAMTSGAPGGLHLGGPPVIEMTDSDRASTRRNLLFIDRESGEMRSAIYDGLADRPAR